MTSGPSIPCPFVSPLPVMIDTLGRLSSGWAGRGPGLSWTCHLGRLEWGPSGLSPAGGPALLPVQREAAGMGQEGHCSAGGGLLHNPSYSLPGPGREGGQLGTRVDLTLS